MLHYSKGDLLQSRAQALVNPVNTMGIMGKGIALQFKEAFPANFKLYAAACKNKELEPGKLLSNWDTNLLYGRKLIINFPTKTNWRLPSKYEYIEKGLVALRDLIRKENIQSVALPPLGCGNGGLDWNIVQPMIENYLGNLPADIFVYSLNENIKALLQQQGRKKREAKLTPARAQLLYALFVYESMGESSSLFAANKLAYFLQRIGQPLKLEFKPYYYGPYAIGVEKVLYELNGTYLDGLEQGKAAPFEPLKLKYERWEEIKKYVETELEQQDKTRLQSLLQLINGFCSERSLEVLATTDFILQEHPDYQIADIMQAISRWSYCKSSLFTTDHVLIAYDHLKQHKHLIA